MHEWALAEAVISCALKAAEREGLSEITRVQIKVGELQQMDMEVFEFAVKEVSQPQNPVLRKARMELETEKAILKCRACSHEWHFGDALKGLDEEQSEAIHFIPEVAHVYIRCPRCESPDFEFVRGRGVWIESIEGE
jgi:hydrogenase nickel incorporation protein HypA/HybF